MAKHYPKRELYFMIMISLHLPKTAGTSLRQVLDRRFGPNLLADYGDLPINTPRPKRELTALAKGARLGWIGLPGAIQCVHGHFLPLKYLALGQPTVFVTWLREPVERLISHYHFWMRVQNPDGLPALHRRVIMEQWDLERFCLGPELRNLYHQFLFGFPRRRLDFVGIVERNAHDFPIFCRRYLGEDMVDGLPQLNMGKNPEERYLKDGTLRRRIEAWHAKDMALYQYYLTK
ncbi:conserved hypothetical protein [Gammaproteobacteria bacterium]